MAKDFPSYPGSEQKLYQQPFGKHHRTWIHASTLASDDDKTVTVDITSLVECYASSRLRRLDGTCNENGRLAIVDYNGHEVHIELS
ncbi:hypothetical protein F5Y19DRAFT_428846 [Xylariaceae sp. FL1651]|nr:hypothetical protein F5Y19DRAFT_428846 [Xylariaceae sp. FL1651]